MHTVCPKKYAHGSCFAVLCCGYILTDFPISTRLTSLALWQSNDCPSAGKATLMNMDKYFMWNHYERLHNHNKAKHNTTVCIFIGIYCTSRDVFAVMMGTDHNDNHYNDVIMSAMASLITSFTIVYSTVYSGADQRKHLGSASLAFVRGIHQWLVNSPHKRPVTRKMFPFDDVIMWSVSIIRDMAKMVTLDQIFVFPGEHICNYVEGCC